MSPATKTRGAARSAPQRIQARFLAPLPPPGLRRNSESRNARHKAALKRAYSEEVRDAYIFQAFTGAARPRYVDMPWRKARLRLTWRSVRMPPDRDNALASCKALIDALRRQQPTDGEGRSWLGLVENDDPGCLDIEVDVVKLTPEERHLEGVLVEIVRRK